MWSFKIPNRMLRILYLLTTGSLLWILVIVLAPVFKSVGNEASEYFYFIFEPVCHQIPERSLFINSEPMAVCTRCFAIYSGAFLYLLFTSIRKRITYINANKLIYFVVPTIVDFLLEKFGLYTNFREIRILTGLFLGVSIIYLILCSIFDVKNKYKIKQKFIYGKSKII